MIELGFHELMELYKSKVISKSTLLTKCGFSQDEIEKEKALINQDCTVSFKASS